jgi:hypothetical protein
MENLKIFFQDYTPVSRGGRGQGTGREGDIYILQRLLEIQKFL